MIRFPQLPLNLINPVAVELTGGLNALTTSDASITYKRQMELQGRGLTREQVLTDLQNFPDEMKVQYVHIDVNDTELSLYLVCRFLYV